MAACMTVFRLVLELVSEMVFPWRRSQRCLTVAALPLMYALFHLFFYVSLRPEFAQASVGRQALYAPLLAVLLVAALWLPTEIARFILR
jgi:hypothetical protein